MKTRLACACMLLAGAASAAEVPPAMSGMLDAHNAVRAEVGVPPLDWSADLAEDAADWAQHLKTENACRMRHSDTREQGENLAWYFNKSPAPAAVARDWAGEKQWYDYASDGCRDGKQCGHYTQMVWADSERVGCAKATCGKEEVWVCRYAPPGNWVGRKPY